MSTPPLTIIDAINDTKLIRPFLVDARNSIESWTNWKVVLKVLYGLRVPKMHHDLVRETTGRKYSSMPSDGFSTALFLTGRRCGKSRMAAVIGFFEAALAGHEMTLAKGEKGMVAICSPTKKQSRVVRGYLEAIAESVTACENIIAGSTRDGFQLSNNVQIELMAGNFRSVRGYTLLSAIVDEAAFFGVEEENSKVSDVELMRALAPALVGSHSATVIRRLIAISSPWQKAGWTFKTYEKNFGNPRGKILVVNSPSRTFNPLLPQKVVDEALENDYEAAQSEFFGKFREPCEALFSRTVLESLVDKSRLEHFPRKGIRYVAFVDMSGGRVDSAALCIAHKDKESGTVVIDLLKEYKPPFSPVYIIGKMVEILRHWKITGVTGDRFGSEYTYQGFADRGIHYTPSDKSASELFLELLPVVSNGGISLPNHEVLLNQLSTLERKPKQNGRELIQHRAGGHDDAAVTVAGACYLASKKLIRVGAF